MRKPTKEPKSFRLSAGARLGLGNLADHYGLSQTAVIEFLIRNAMRKWKRVREGQVKDEKRKPRKT